MLAVDVLLTAMTIGFALTVVFSKKTVISAFALLMTLLSVAMIYFQLGAIFLSAIQVLVNAGAIAILFVFVMMLINLEEIPKNNERGTVKLVITSFTMLVALGVFALIINNNIESLTVVNLGDDSMKTLFEKLFSVYYLPFEIATVLLLAAIVASIVITGHEKAKQVEDVEKIQ